MRNASSASGEQSREQVRQQYLAACTAGDEHAPPDIDALVAAFLEPERSALRAELESLQRTHARPTKADSGNDTRDFDPAGTSDFVPPAVGTIDQAPAPAPDGTVDHAPAPPGTIDQVVTVKRSREVPLPDSVAGYEVLGVLGRGAMGVVYKARQRGLKRLVALKMILSGEHASANDLGRFQAEANAVAQLQHPGIIQIYEVGEDGGRPFFSLEFVDGTSLHKKLQGVPLPPREAAQLLQQMAEAMNYAHEHGIIHRDLKPANVLLTSDGVPKIGDFGLAKQLGDDESGMTRTGTVLGTPSYMSPEQAEGRLADVGPLADVYSLGAVLYDMLTGRPPFRGTSVLDTLEQLRTREPVPPMQFQPGVPRDLETICLKCLQKDRTKRYATAGELAADVGRFLRGEPIKARPVGLIERSWRWCRRNKAKTAVIVAAVLAVIGYGITVTVLNQLLAVQTQEAVEKRKLAEAREEEQRQTAGVAVDMLAQSSAKTFSLLQNRRLSIGASPEVKKARADALDDLRTHLVNMGIKLQANTTVGFADLKNAQLVGDILRKLGLAEQARKTYETGVKAAHQHVTADPDNDKARANLGVMEQRVGEVALELEGDARTALEHFLTTRRLHAEIQRQPKQGSYSPTEIQRILAGDDRLVGTALLALGRAAEARTYLEESLQYRQEWFAAEPKSAEPQGYCAQSQMLLGIAATQLGDRPAAVKHLDAALELIRDLNQRHPKYLDFYKDVAEVEGAYGDLWLRAGKPADAQAHYREALDKLKVPLAKNPDAIEYQPTLALTHERLGLAAQLLKQDAEAREHFKQAKQLREELWDIDRNNLWRKAGLVLAMARAGDRANALRLGQAIKPQMAQSTELTLQVARIFARLAAGDPKGAAKNAGEALSILAAATDKDYRDAAVLEADPDLAPLRGQPAFQELVARLKGR